MNNTIDTMILSIASELRLEVTVVFIFEKPRSACGVIENPRSISVRLMTIKCNSGASTPTVHCCDFDKTGAQSI